MSFLDAIDPLLTSLRTILTVGNPVRTASYVPSVDESSTTRISGAGPVSAEQFSSVLSSSLLRLCVAIMIVTRGVSLIGGLCSPTMIFDPRLRHFEHHRADRAQRQVVHGQTRQVCRTCLAKRFIGGSRWVGRIFSSISNLPDWSS